MSCCEESRLAAMTRPSWEGRAVLIRYAGARPITAIGMVTGRRYRFSGTAREQPVDPRDAAAFLGGRGFRAVGVVRLNDDGEHVRQSALTEE